MFIVVIVAAVVPLGAIFWRIAKQNAQYPTLVGRAIHPTRDQDEDETQAEDVIVIWNLLKPSA